MLCPNTTLSTSALSDDAGSIGSIAGNGRAEVKEVGTRCSCLKPCPRPLEWARIKDARKPLAERDERIAPRNSPLVTAFSQNHFQSVHKALRWGDMGTDCSFLGKYPLAVVTPEHPVFCSVLELSFLLHSSSTHCISSAFVPQVLRCSIDYSVPDISFSPLCCSARVPASHLIGVSPPSSPRCGLPSDYSPPVASSKDRTETPPPQYVILEHSSRTRLLLTRPYLVVSECYLSECNIPRSSSG